MAAVKLADKDSFKVLPPVNISSILYFKEDIADSAQTEYCTTFHCSSVCSCVTGVTSHISHIYKSINAMLIIRGPIKPYIF